ncbi:MAG: hypothetical protein LKJ21_02065 [Oscillospiraceae bacterium]|jgi:hypothetical protein|nr:hypothetical protein [Oscillospiraceae bacterium]MCI1989762.1 hypothetical protein [Oscillospiraceae bacterium]MCI2034365.1 hypothetical protein [Oscillospiraceae bacterium]
MLNWNLLAAYRGPAGPVSGENIGAALRLMGLGMLGIFIVMLLIYLVVYLLNKGTGRGNGKDDD